MYNYSLYHHGIKGQRWGVRRFQDKNGRLTNAGKKRYSEDSKRESDETKRKGLTDKQKKAIKIGAAVAATALVSYGAYKLYSNKKSPTGLSLDLAGSAGLKLKAKNSSIIEDLKAVNPNRTSLAKEYHQNCGNCSIAYELRRRGYDVEALGNSVGMLPSQMGMFFKNLSQESFTNIDVDPKITDGKVIGNAISSGLKNKYPDGSRGCVFFPHKAGAHFFNWEIINDKVSFTDSQLNISDLSKTQLFDQYRHVKNSNGIQCIRFDNLDINMDQVKSVVHNVGERIDSSAEKFDSYVVKGSDFVMKLK